MTKILPAGTWTIASAADRIVLDAGDRQRRRIVLVGETGTAILLDLDKPVALHDGDGLVLDDGSIVAVLGEPEELIEARTRIKADVVRLAWHVGNRHTEVQVIGERLRLRRDSVLEDMLRGLGADLTSVEASFEPEAVASYRHERHE